MKKVICLVFIVGFILCGCSMEEFDEHNFNKEVVSVVDTSHEGMNIMIIVQFYEDELYEYYFSNPGVSYTITYDDGTTEDLAEALYNEHVSVSILDKYDVHYYREFKTLID